VRPVPRLRGVLHQYAFVGAVAAGGTLIAVADGARERLALSIYTTALAALFGVSAMYHRASWRSARARARARRLDHAMIFVFIAGTYTAFSLLAFSGALRTVLLSVVWGGAAVGIVVELAWGHAPRWVSVAAYLAVGWAGIIAVPQLFPALGVAPAVLVITGGALYSLGAFAYATTWPDPFPATFGFHEVFHALVVAAGAAQLVAVSLLAV
jgi:hemolysin III